MHFYSLGSGSSGNGFLLDTGDVALLVDCGIGVRRIQAAMREFRVQDRLAGIVLSHEHSDHVRALPSVMRRVSCPLITTTGTYNALQTEYPWTARAAGERYAVGGIEVGFVSVSHDAEEPCGFTIDHDGMRIAVFTDLGIVSDEVLESLRTADVVVLEANYDTQMLQTGPYPAHLKRRIRGPAGHLSNDDSAAALAETVTDKTRQVWLAHLSDTNNTPTLAVQTVREALSLRGLETPVAHLPRYEQAALTASDIVMR